MRQRVAITGLGCTTPVGNDVTSTWDSLLGGLSGIDYITCFDASSFPSKVAGEVKGFDPAAFIDDTNLVAHTSRGHQLGIAAALMAYQDAALGAEELDSGRKGVSIGATGEYPDFSQLSHYHQFSDGRKWNHTAFGKAASIPPAWYFQRSVFMASCAIAKLLNFTGPNVAIHTACASGSHAIGQAYRIIQRGDAAAMIAGGSDAITTPLWITAFALMGALSTQDIEPRKASRPFDANRDGFVIAEGSGMVLLEELRGAEQRGANIYAEIVGFGTSSNAFRVTDSPMDGAGALKAMQRAIDEAGIRPRDIQYINAHGTSTPQNDVSETMAIKDLLGKYAYNVPVSSIKSMIGHLISGAGALGVISSALTIKESAIPPTINYENPDPLCDLDYVPNTMRPKDIRYALANSFGFGGQNACIALTKYEPA